MYLAIVIWSYLSLGESVSCSFNTINKSCLTIFHRLTKNKYETTRRRIFWFCAESLRIKIYHHFIGSFFRMLGRQCPLSPGFVPHRIGRTSHVRVLKSVHRRFEGATRAARFWFDLCDRYSDMVINERTGCAESAGYIDFCGARFNLFETRYCLI